MWRGCKTDARRRGDTRAKAGGIPRPRQGAPGTAHGQGESGGNSSGDLVIATFEAVVAGTAAAARAASALPGGTRGADHARALRAVAAAAATAAGVAAELLACHVAWLSEAEMGLSEASPPRPNASPAGKAGASSGRGSARTVSRRMRCTRARDAAGLQAEAEVAEGGAEESAPPGKQRRGPGCSPRVANPGRTPATRHGVHERRGRRARRGGN
jgi:hypothetical protein